jgi:hypothetical protein
VLHRGILWGMLRILHRDVLFGSHQVLLASDPLYAPLPVSLLVPLHYPLSIYPRELLRVLH